MLGRTVLGMKEYMGKRDLEEEMWKVMDYWKLQSAEITILNTRLKKRGNHLIIYISGENETQIYYIMVRK